MKKLFFLAILFMISQIHANSEMNINQFITYHLEHFTNDVEGEPIPSNPPNELLLNLKRFSKSPIGSEIIRTALVNNITVSFIQGHFVDEAFTAYENTIIYTLDVKGWYKNKIVEFENLPTGSNLEKIGLDVLLAHEFGHTELGRRTLNIPAIDPFVRSEARSGSVTTVFSRAKIRKEELRAARLFENAYRSYLDIPLRRSYYVEDDVLIN